MRVKKMLSMILTSALTVGLLAGCGSSSQPTNEAPKEQAETPADGSIVVGAAMPVFDDKWLTYLYDAINNYDKEHDEVEVKMVDAKNDSGKQLSQVETFIAQGVDAIIIGPVDTSAVGPMVDAANKANIPVVLVNRMPDDAVLQKIYAYVGSDSKLAGTIQMEEVTKLLGGKGNVAILTGELGSDSQIKRTEGNKEIIDKNPDMKLLREQTALYQRAEGMKVMENWIQSGDQIDAIVANNDEMAIGAMMALEAAGQLEGKVIAGIDGTPDALEYIKAGKLSASAFQDPVGQGKGAIEAAIKAAKGEKLEGGSNIIDVPFQLITKDNVDTYIQKWQQ
ncbi:sugar ABC transporter substrate-binding protein [Ammoniphilus sp. 3BR4]|uniref:sugar ABC transporter substrate-binding protein n=1 Tax=Ammoniphilus sp. 3BR4 TaxID=3158265 RepID=UPI0034675862